MHECCVCQPELPQQSTVDSWLKNKGNLFSHSFGGWSPNHHAGRLSFCWGLSFWVLMAAFPLCFPHGLSLGCVCIGLGGGKERTEREEETEPDRRRGREMERQREKETERWRERERERDERQREGERWRDTERRDREEERQTDRERGVERLCSLFSKDPPPRSSLSSGQDLALSLPRTKRYDQKKKKKRTLFVQVEGHPCDLTSP